MLAGKNNPRVKYVRRLTRRKYRDQEGKFIVEGVRFVEEAAGARWPLEMVLYSPKLSENPRGAHLLGLLDRQGVPMLAVEDQLLAQLTDTESPQGVLAVAPVPRHQPATSAAWNNPACDLLVLVDGIRDPGNLGTMIRSADAAGAQGLFITRGTVDPYNAKTLRSTMGSIFRVPIVMIRELDGFLAFLKSGGWKLVAGDLAAGRMLYHSDLTGRVVMVVGGEAYGITEAVRQGVDEKVLIPMPGGAESLNAGVALGIMLYEVVRQRAGKP